MLTQSNYEHILINDSGDPIIAGTNTKVIEIVLDKIAYGWSAEELHYQHQHISLGQIHSALAYYWDHQEEIDADIEQRLRKVEQLRSRTNSSDLARRLRAQGLLD